MAKNENLNLLLRSAKLGAVTLALVALNACKPQSQQPCPECKDNNVNTNVININAGQTDYRDVPVAEGNTNTNVVNINVPQAERRNDTVYVVIKEEPVVQPKPQPKPKPQPAPQPAPVKPVQDTVKPASQPVVEPVKKDTTVTTKSYKCGHESVKFHFAVNGYGSR